MTSSPDRRPRRRLAVLFTAVALVLTAPGVASASVTTQNFLAADFDVQPARTGFYDYTAGVAKTWTTQADFAAGTHTSTRDDLVVDAVTLDPVGPAGTMLPDVATIAWWDKNWDTRTCYDVDHTAPGAQAVTEYQVRLQLDLAGLVAGGFLQPDTGDLRAVAADGATQLDMWVEGPVTSSSGVVWVQVDSIPAGGTTHFCLYYGHPSGPVAPLANHTEAAVFTHTVRKPVYYAVSGRYGTNPSSLSVVSLVAANSVQRDAGAPVALAAAGDRASFNAAGTTPASVFSTLGPISSRGDANAYDTLVPISWAGTDFAIPTARNPQRFSFYAPFADATVSIFNGGAAVPYATFVVPAGTQYTHNAGDVTGSNAGLVSATAPVLVTHVSSNGRDAVAVPPATTADLYGVHSTSVRIGVTTNGTNITVQRSNGTTQNYANNRGQTRVVGGGGSQGGNVSGGFKVGADQPIGSIQQADSDGLESTTFLPREELNAEYWLPTNSQYVAFSCPDAAAGFTITITPPAGAPRNVTCVGPGAAQPTFPGWARDTANLNVTAGRGIRVHSPGGEQFFAYYEHRANNDETNLVGMKQGRQYTWPEPVLTAGTEGLVAPAGTWESATYDTGGAGVFGEIDWAATLPVAATSVSFQVATGPVDPPAAFVGPDGTAATFFTALPDVLAYAHDGDRYLRVRAYLATTDRCYSPELDDVTVDHDLPDLAHPLNGAGTITIAGTVGASTRHYLVRATTSDPALAASQAQLRYLSGVTLGNVVNAELTFENFPAGFTSSQLTVAGGPPAPATGPLELWDAGAPHSIVVTEEMVAGGATIDVRWRTQIAGSPSRYADRDISLVITS